MLHDFESKFTEIQFLVEKVHAHYWPLDSPKWSDVTNQQVDNELNKNKWKKQIVIKNNTILVDKYEFTSIKKIGITIPLFKKQCTLVFEGHFKEFCAHVHITINEENYLEIFNKLMCWRTKYHPDSILS